MSLDGWSFDTYKPCPWGKETKTPHLGKTGCELKLLKYCTWWCIISANSGNHYYVNFIVRFSKYVYLLNEIQVWNYLKCSKNFRMKEDMKLTRKLSRCDFDRSDKYFRVMFWHIRTCEKCFTNYDASSNSICWYELSIIIIPYGILYGLNNLLPCYYII
jgi:hypothetical protein